MAKFIKGIITTVVILALLAVIGYLGYLVYNLAVENARQRITSGVSEGIAHGLKDTINPFKNIIK